MKNRLSRSLLVLALALGVSVAQGGATISWNVQGLMAAYSNHTMSATALSNAVVYGFVGTATDKTNAARAAATGHQDDWDSFLSGYPPGKQLGVALTSATGYGQRLNQGTFPGGSTQTVFLVVFDAHTVGTAHNYLITELFTPALPSLGSKTVEFGTPAGDYVPDTWTDVGGATPAVAPTVSIMAPLNGATVMLGAATNLQVTAADSDGSVTNVAFYVDGVLVGNDTSAPYAISWLPVALGSHTLTAVATDNVGLSNTSTPVTITVKTTAGVLGYIAGDFHQHTTYTDGNNSFLTMMYQNNAFGLDWWANSEHGGKFSTDARGPQAAPAGPFNVNGGYAWTNLTYYPVAPFKGDASTPNMWRWQSLQEYSFQDVLAARATYARPILQSYEWNVPGHEHCSMGRIDGQFGSAPNATALAQFEYLWDGNDTDLSGGGTNGWLAGSSKNYTNNHAKALQAVAWLQANSPLSSYLVFAHPERRGVQSYPPTYTGTGSQGYSVAAFRDLNSAGPDVAFGFESMPGHQKEGGRGGYGTGASGGGTFGGCGVYAAKVGGVWDAMLGEGRKFWLFASSDFHNTVNDFWPGEYQKNYTRITVPNDPQAIVNGLRSGDNYVVEGDVIDGLEFTVNGARMGACTVNADGTANVSIQVHVPAMNNGPAGQNTPALDHLDVIAGQFGAPAVPGTPAYTNPVNATAQVIARFGASASGPDANGLTNTAWSDLGGGWKQMTLSYNTQHKSTYFRLRGTNRGINDGQTDAAGNPLVDAQGNTASNAWDDLWFYSNPVFVKAQMPQIKVDTKVYQAFDVSLTNQSWVYLDADPLADSPLRATQRSLGYREVTYKSLMFSNLQFMAVAPVTNGSVVSYDYTSQKTKGSYTVGYWADKDLPVMIGPDGKAYITDGHHTTAGYLAPSNGQVGDFVPGLHRVVLGHITTNFYAGAPFALNDTWWTARMAENNAFLYGVNGNQLTLPGEPNYAGLQPLLPSGTPMPLTPSAIGPNAMTHDRYRGLAWGLADGIFKSAIAANNKTIKGFSKTTPFIASKPDVNFVEFFWSDFLRNRIVWDDTKTSTGAGDNNAISAPVSFFAAVANATALAKSSDYRDQYGRNLSDYKNGALFSSNTVLWANASLTNGLAVASDTYNLYLLDDSTIAGDIKPSPVSTNRLHINTVAGMNITGRVNNVRDLLVNAGHSVVTTWKDAVVTNHTITIPAGTGTVTLQGTNTFPGTVQISAGKLALTGPLTAGSLTLASGATLECVPGTSSSALTVSGALALNGTLRVNDTGLGAGNYRLFNYGGALSTNGLTVILASGSKFVFALDTTTPGQVNVRIQTQAGALSYVAGDFHQHTTYTDGNNSFLTMMYQNNAFGLDWWANSEHGGKFSTDARGPLAAPAGPFNANGGYAWTNLTYYPVAPFKGDASTPNMWRWQSLQEYSFQDVLVARATYARPVLQSYEWNVPGHEHCSMGRIDGQFGSAPNATALAQFEYLWDGNDTDLSGGGTNGWLAGSSKNNTNNHAKAVQAVAWLQANSPLSSYLVFAHPERRGVQSYPPTYTGSGSQGYSVAAFRDLNSAGPDVAFGFESMPGHQKSGGRGGYGTGASGGGTFGGCGVYAAQVGGVWDALLGDGRKFWLFASSDFHTTVEDFWPGEYQKNYTRITATNDPQAIVNGLRSGDNYVVEGDVIDGLEFTVNGTRMGGFTVNADGTANVSIQVHVPAMNNGPAGQNTPALDHLDVIAGQFGAPAVPGTAAYTNPVNATAQVIARFGASASGPDANGLTNTAWSDLGGGWKQMTLSYNTQHKSTYFRLRGTNRGINDGQTDAAGNPLVDAQGNTASNAWDDLWFYSNPVFVQAATATLAVSTAHGTAVPTGVTTQVVGTTVSASVDALVAAGATQYVCTGWTATGCQPASGTSNLAVFTVNDPAALAWRWQTNFWLATATVGDGRVTPSDNWQPSGSNVVLTALPATNRRLLGWSGDTNGCVSTGNTLNVPMTHARTIMATFAQTGTVAITTVAAPAAGGSVKGGGSYSAGFVTNLTAVPKIRYVFSAWQDGVTNPVRRVLVLTNATYTATFVPAATLTVKASPVAGGVVFGGGIFPVGATQTVRAVANPGWRFKQWQDRNTNALRQVVLKATTTYTATFVQQGVVRGVASPAMAGRVTGGGTYDGQQRVTLTAVSTNDLFVFGQWTDRVRTSARSVTVAAGKTNSYSAVFVTAVVVRASLVGAGSVTVSPAPVEGGKLVDGVKFARGTKITLTAKASKGGRFVQWSDGETKSIRTFPALATNVTVQAYFIQPASTRGTAGAAKFLTAGEFQVSDGAGEPAMAVLLDGVEMPAGLLDGAELLTVTVRGGALVLDVTAPAANAEPVLWSGALCVQGTDADGDGVPDRLADGPLADGTVMLRVRWVDGVLLAETPLPGNLTVVPAATTFGPWPMEWLLTPAP